MIIMGFTRHVLRVMRWGKLCANGCCTMTMTLYLAVVWFTPLSFAEVRAHTWGSVSWEAWAGLCYRATVGMVMAMTLWGRPIHRLGPQLTMLYVYLEPVSAVVIAAAVLGEWLRPVHVVGALLAFVGVGLASSQEQPGHAKGVGNTSPSQELPKHLAHWGSPAQFFSVGRLRSGVRASPQHGGAIHFPEPRLSQRLWG
jgi:EamA-like transporter family